MAKSQKHKALEKFWGKPVNKDQYDEIFLENDENEVDPAAEYIELSKKKAKGIKKNSLDQIEKEERLPVVEKIKITFGKMIGRPVNSKKVAENEHIKLIINGIRWKIYIHKHDVVSKLSSLASIFDTNKHQILENINKLKEERKTGQFAITRLKESAKVLQSQLNAQNLEASNLEQVNLLDNFISLICDLELLTSDDIPPLFNSLESAHSWLFNERESFVQGNHKAAEERIMNYPLEHFIRNKREPVPDWYPYKTISELIYVWLPTTKHNSSNRSMFLDYSNHGFINLSNSRPDHLPNEIGYYACTKILKELAAYAKNISVISLCWSLGQVTEYILTGKIPEIKVLQLLALETPDGGIKGHIELYGIPNRQEWNEMYKILKEKAGLSKKKDFTYTDQILIEFVESRRKNNKPIWKELLKIWNKQNPQWAKDDYRLLWQAYNRAKKRESQFS